MNRFSMGYDWQKLKSWEAKEDVLDSIGARMWLNAEETGVYNEWNFEYVTGLEYQTWDNAWTMSWRSYTRLFNKPWSDYNRHRAMEWALSVLEEDEFPKFVEAEWVFDMLLGNEREGDIDDMSVLEHVVTGPFGGGVEECMMHFEHAMWTKKEKIYNRAKKAQVLLRCGFLAPCVRYLRSDGTSFRMAKAQGELLRTMDDPMMDDVELEQLEFVTTCPWYEGSDTFPEIWLTDDIYERVMYHGNQIWHD